MGIMVYSLLWVMQDFVHQPYGSKATPRAALNQERSHKFVLIRNFDSPSKSASCGVSND